MAKGFITLFYLLAVVLPLLALYISTYYTVSYTDVEFTPAGLFVDAVFSDIATIVAVDSAISRVNATHVAIGANSTLPKDMATISANMQLYRTLLQTVLDSYGWNYTLDLTQLETDAPLNVFFTTGNRVVFDNNDYDATFYGSANVQQVNTTVVYDPQGFPFFRFPWAISFPPGPLEWNIQIDDGLGPTITYNANVDPNGFNYVIILYFPPLSLLNVQLTNIGGQPASSRVVETPTNRQGTGSVQFQYLVEEHNYTFMYLPGNLTINQSNVYKSPIGIVIGEG